MGTMDLQPHEMKMLQDRIKADVDKYSIATLSDEHRTHLGASVIGHECARHIWYAFRWVKFEMFSGRQLRLFERGHLEEARFIKILRGIGFQVWEVDETTGKQFRIWGAQGHYGGSADSKGTMPYPELTEPLLIEYKTHNKASFAKLEKEGMILSKPRHYAQMCSYGEEFKFRYGLYCAVDKDDDDFYFEIVPLDPRHADDLRKKAGDIIFSNIPPPKLSLQPEYYECKFCAFAGICHHNHAVEKNCRSCRFSQPAPNAEWGCNHWNALIPKDIIPKGCDHFQGIV